MEYHIEAKGSGKKWDRIASFQHIMDRDDCMEYLQGRYGDVKFRGIDD